MFRMDSTAGTCSHTNCAGGRQISLMNQAIRPMNSTTRNPARYSPSTTSNSGHLAAISRKLDAMAATVPSRRPTIKNGIRARGNATMCTTPTRHVSRSVGSPAGNAARRNGPESKLTPWIATRIAPRTTKGPRCSGYFAVEPPQSCSDGIPWGIVGTPFCRRMNPRGSS